MRLFHFPKTIRFENGDVYKGDVKDGRPSGKGVMRYANGDVYEGEFARGYRNGTGKMTYANGGCYEGEFFLGDPSGKGTMHYPSGNVYEGSVIGGKLSGQGVMHYANGDVYKGEFDNDICHGKGKKTYANGDVYNGEFRDGKRHGKGSLQIKNGGSYSGDFTEDKRTGRGVAIGWDGTVSEGIFLDGRLNDPNGFVHYPNGNVFEGSMVNGKAEGRAKATFSSGQVYEGEFKKSKFNGEGVMRYTNGDVYKGSFVDGVRSGQGVMTYADGTVYSGTWKDDEPVEKDKLPASQRGKAGQSAPKAETRPQTKFQTQSSGKLVMDNGSVYEGELKDGMPNGKGTMRCVGHEWYEELFFNRNTWNSNRNELLFSENGTIGAEINVYEGSFKEGKRNGYGEIRYANGSMFKGYYRDGLPYDGKGMVYAKDDPQPLAFIELEATAFGGAQDGVSLWWIWPNTQR